MGNIFSNSLTKLLTQLKEKFYRYLLRALDSTSKNDSTSLKLYFESLNLSDWKMSSYFKSGGQAMIGEVKNINTKEVGVFRTLKAPKSPEDIARFYQELKILKNTSHPSVVEILSHTQDIDNQWYISRKGEPFETWWRKFVKRSKSRPDDIFDKAVTVIFELTEGLVDLHSQGIVHRDIKAKNLIRINNRAVLIDFGIAFVTGEERVTLVNEAVGNVYSPDPSLNFMADVPPWLDIFLLSQLFIWMVSENTNKPHIQRPLDWRFVVYPPDLESSKKLSALAFTSLCSNSIYAPQNAGELIPLLNLLFKTSEIRKNQMDLKKTLEVIRQGKAGQIKYKSEIRTDIENKHPLFLKIASDVELSINTWIEEMIDANVLEVRQVANGSIKEFSNYILTAKNLLPIHRERLTYLFGDEDSSFGFDLTYVLCTKDHLIDGHDEDTPIVNQPCLQIALNQRNAALAQAGKQEDFYALPQVDGKLALLDRNNDLILTKTVTVEEFITMIKESALNPQTWEIVLQA